MIRRRIITRSFCPSPSRGEVHRVRAGEIENIEELTAFKIRPGKNEWILIVHPLWDLETLPGIMGRAYRALDRRGAKIEFADTFELSRSQVKVRERLITNLRIR